MRSTTHDRQLVLAKQDFRKRDDESRRPVSRHEHARRVLWWFEWRNMVLGAGARQRVEVRSRRGGRG